RTARDRTIWKRAVAQLDVDLVQRNARLLGRELREDGVHSGADVLRGTRDADGPVVAQLNVGGGGKSPGDPCGAGHSPTECQPIALHRADGRVSFRPPELLGTESEALHVMTGREWQLQGLVELRLVENAELGGIHLEPLRHLV